MGKWVVLELIGRAWTRDEIAQLVETFEQGRSVGVLADRLDRTLAAVQAKAKRIGLRFAGASPSSIHLENAG